MNQQLERENEMRDLEDGFDRGMTLQKLAYIHARLKHALYAEVVGGAGDSHYIFDEIFETIESLVPWLKETTEPE